MNCDLIETCAEFIFTCCVLAGTEKTVTDCPISEGNKVRGLCLRCFRTQLFDAMNIKFYSTYIIYLIGIIERGGGAVG